MELTVLLPSFGVTMVPALGMAADLGFTQVDIVAAVERSTEETEALAESGLLVACAALGKDLPEDYALDAPDVATRRATLDALKRQLDDAARLGARFTYIVPGRDASADGVARFTDACRLLADHAQARKLPVCVEHVPGRALGEARRVLEWLDQVGHPNLYLLLDVGHCLISAEDAPALLRSSGARLGYVHFDDNDGERDLHWPLLQGRLTEAGLHAVLQALSTIKYQGALCLELSPTTPEPREAVRQGKELLQRLRNT